MAENEEENEEKKKKSSNKSTVIIVIIIMLLLIPAASYYVIVNGVVELITEVVDNIMGFVNNPGATFEGMYNSTINSISYVLNLPWYKRPSGEGCTIILNDSAVETIKENIKNQAIDLKSAGLSDTVIKKMILVNYMTTCTVDTEIALPISEEEKIELLKEKKVDVMGKDISDDIFMYWQGDGNGRGESGKWYISVCGIVKLVDEKGEAIVSYRQSTIDGFIKELEDRFNANKDNAISNMRNQIEHSYSTEVPGTIKLAKITTTDIKTTYKYGNENLVEEDENGLFKSEYVTLNYSQYISQYAMPMDFLVSLLEITGSDGFVEAVCDLVGESEIKVVVAANQSARIDYDSTKYLDTVTVEGIQQIQNQNGDIDYQSVSVKEVVMDTLIPGETVNVIEEKQTITRDTQYDIFVQEVNTWYCKAKYEINNDWHGNFISLDEGGNEVVTEREYYGQSYDINSMINELEEAKKNRIWVKQTEDEIKEERKFYSGDPKNLEETFKVALDSSGVREQLNRAKNTRTNTRNKSIFDANLLYTICQRKNFFKNENLNKDFTPQVGTVFGFPRVTKLRQEKVGTEKSQFSIIGEKQINGTNTTTDYEDKTDKFLGLLKNNLGKYTKGASFKSDGKVVYYDDVYGGVIPPGELLVDGEEVLYQLMESSSSYNKGLENIMKYIIKRYKGESVTAGDFDDAINWLKKINFDGIGDGSAQECWRKMLESFEDAKMTQDGKKYLLLDGIKNDPYHSISTAYGLKLYEKEDYNDIDYQVPFNNAYKDCNINLTLKEALKDLIVNGEVQYQLANSNYEFPEKYALPKEVVDTAMNYILSSKEDEIKKLVDRYNKEYGKNLTLTTQQIQAIADAHWQYVVESFDPYEFIKAYGNLKDGVNDKNIDSLRTSFIPFNDNTYGRANGRWKLFTEGIYTLKDGTTLTSGFGGNIVDAAKALVELTKLGGKEQVSYAAARRSSKGYSSSIYVCASFVSETLYNAAGLKNWSDGVDGIGRILYNDPNYELIYYNASSSATPSIANFSESKNLTQNIEKLVQPGDIVATFVKGSYTFGHVVIYIGDNQYAHHGGGSGAYNYPNIGTGFFARYTNDNIKYVFRYKK